MKINNSFNQIKKKHGIKAFSNLNNNQILINNNISCH
jgi:hypothetical protein